MVFKFVNDESKKTQSIQYLIGTNTEAFVVGEILTLSSGVATKAAVDSDGTQRFICLKAVTGDGSTADVPVIELRETMEFETRSSGQIATTAVDSKYTLTSAATGITATTSKGVFRVIYTDGSTTSLVRGRFTGADVL